MSPPNGHLRLLRLLWPFLVLLASFVFFVEFIADVGGSAEPPRAPSPLISPTPSPSPTPTSSPLPDTSLLPGIDGVVPVIAGGSVEVSLAEETVRLRDNGVHAPEPGDLLPPLPRRRPEEDPWAP